MGRLVFSRGNSVMGASPRVVNSGGANNMTGTATVLSDPIDLRNVDTAASLEIQIAGTPTGTLSLLGSNQYDVQLNPNATFVPLAAGAVTPVLPTVAGAGSTTICALAAQALGCRYVQLKYVNTSGTGTLDVWAHGRGVT
jgi:hypothetical protein